MEKKKITQAQQSSESEKPETKENQKPDDEKTEPANGKGGIFANIPRVRNYDYDDEIKGKV